jgi:hypothetical protein
MKDDELRKLVEAITEPPWEYIETVSPDGQEWLGCGVVGARGNEFVWIEEMAEEAIPTARLIALAPTLAREVLALREAAKELADAVKDWSECDEPALVDTIIEDMTAAHANLRTVLGENK